MPDLSLSGAQLNIGASGERFDLKVAALKNGTFVAVWTQYDTINRDTDANIMAQIYNADGTPKNDSPPVRVNTVIPGGQRNPSVTALNDGGFAIAWEDYSQGTISDIRARIYDATGTATTQQDFVAGATEGVQLAPHITSFGDKIVVSFLTQIIDNIVRSESYSYNRIGQPNGGSSLDGRFESQSSAEIINAPDDARYKGMLIHVALSPSTNLIKVQAHSAPLTSIPAASWDIPTGSGTSSSVSVTALAGGRFVIAWKDWDPSTQNAYKIKAVIYETDGDASAVKVLSESSTEINRPVVAALPDGGFAIAYENDNDVQAQIYDGSGIKTHNPIVVHGPSDDQQEATIRALADGRFVVGWENIGAGAALTLRAQIVDPRADAVRWTGTSADEQFGGTDFTLGDTLDGGAGNDALYGMGGDDRLIGTAGGDDRFFGGAGTDTVSYLGATGGVGVYLLNRTNNTGAAARDVFDSIEVIEGTNHRNTLEGGNGNDTLKGASGNDILNGFKGDDDFFGEGGDDVLFGGEGGADDFHGGEGKDTVSYSGGGGVQVYLSGRLANGGAAFGDTYTEIEVIEGSQEADILEGGTGNDIFWADADNDRLSGLDGDDTLYGATGNDVLDGGAGRDELYGDEDDDTYIVDALDVIVEASGKGTDTLIANTSYTLAANAEMETLYAGADAGNINLTGNGIGNILFGNRGSNRLDGGGGNDTLMLTGDRDEYTVRLNADGSVTLTDKIAGRDGTDTIYNVEIFQFGNTKLSLAGLAGGTQSSLTGDVVAENSATAPALVRSFHRQADHCALLSSVMRTGVSRWTPQARSRSPTGSSSITSRRASIPSRCGRPMPLAQAPTRLSRSWFRMFSTSGLSAAPAPT
ncbi:calcium-binding protein [Microvirga arabica]|uniref:Calcium-binding protein n=1 Tax=Microvirga arabica TaxID=1128671 RepID=A0ABV6Y3N5_9HYPH